MNYYVYYLLDPGTGDLLYIGRSHRPRTRQLYFEKRTGLSTVLGVSQRFSSFEEACAAELKAITRHHPPWNKSVQSSNGRYGHKGHRISDWHKNQISLTNRARVLTPEHKLRISASLRGKTLGPETRAKIAAANIGKKQSPETIAKRLASIAANRV